MTLFSENSEKDYIPLSQLIKNFNLSGNNKLDVKDIIKLLVSEKIRFFVYVSGDQHKIKLSKRDNASYFYHGSFKLNIDEFRDARGRMCCYRNDLLNKNFEHNIKDVLIAENKSTIDFCGYIEKAYEYNDYCGLMYVLGDEVKFSGFFELSYSLEKMNYNGVEVISNALYDFIEISSEMPLLVDGLYNKELDFYIENSNLFNETVKSLEICYLEDIYLSRIEFNKLFYELELLKPIEQTPQNNESEELKKELEELKKRNKELNLENKRLDRELDKLKNGELLNSDKHYQNLIIGLVYKFHDDYKKSRKHYFIAGRPNISGIAENVIDTLTDLNNKNIFNDDVYGKTILSGKLTSAFNALKLPKS